MIIGAAAEAQELDVAGDLVVAPRVVGDRRCRCAAAGGSCRRSHRPDRGLRCSVWVSSRPSLPLCHGNIAPAWPSRLAARRAGAEPPEPVAEQRPGQDREPQVEEREDEQLVPEDVPAVGLAVEPRAGTPTSRSMVLGDTVCSRWKMWSRRTSSASTLAGERQVEAPPQLVPGEHVAARAARSKPPASSTRVRAPPARPPRSPRSRDVWRATTFSTVSGSPRARRRRRCSWATKPGCSITRGRSATGRSSIATRRARRLGDDDAATAASAPAGRSPSSPVAPVRRGRDGRRAGPGSARRRGWSTVPSSAERTLDRPRPVLGDERRSRAPPGAGAPCRRAAAGDTRDPARPRRGSDATG